MTDIDMDLKRLFDERLGAVTPLPRRGRRAHRSFRIAVGAGIAALVIAGAGVAADVNTVAATNGLGCADFLTKVQAWAQIHRSDLARTDHSAAKAELAKMVAEAGCAPHDAAHDRSHIGPHH